MFITVCPLFGQQDEQLGKVFRINSETNKQDAVVFIDQHILCYYQRRQDTIYFDYQHYEVDAKGDLHYCDTLIPDSYFFSIDKGPHYSNNEGLLCFYALDKYPISLLIEVYVNGTLLAQVHHPNTIHFANFPEGSYIKVKSDWLQEADGMIYQLSDFKAIGTPFGIVSKIPRDLENSIEAAEPKVLEVPLLKWENGALLDVKNSKYCDQE